jgi:thymidylate synthase
VGSIVPARDGSHRPRLSALQVSCFDPPKDHTGQPVRGFPCLQQVSFAYDNSGGLAVSAYYPSQYIFDRGYGNYLGLCHLGQFMASEMGLQLVRLNCYVNSPLRGDTPKRALGDLAIQAATVVN